MGPAGITGDGDWDGPAGGRAGRDVGRLQGTREESPGPRCCNTKFALSQQETIVRSQKQRRDRNGRDVQVKI